MNSYISGLHGIIPRIVDQYLGGLRYENLSCCANTGFEGYYAITEFMAAPCAVDQGGGPVHQPEQRGARPGQST